MLLKARLTDSRWRPRKFWCDCRARSPALFCRSPGRPPRRGHRRTRWAGSTPHPLPGPLHPAYLPCAGLCWPSALLPGPSCPHSLTWLFLLETLLWPPEPGSSWFLRAPSLIPAIQPLPRGLCHPLTPQISCRQGELDITEWPPSKLDWQIMRPHPGTTAGPPHPRRPWFLPCTAQAPWKAPISLH